MAIKLRHTIEDVSDREQLKKLYDEIKLKLVPLETYKIYFVDEKPPRSLPMNNYYWGVVVKMIAEYMGEDGPQVHEYLKIEFNPKQITVGGKTVTFGGSTAVLTNQEFIEYWEKIRIWAGEFLLLDIPLPNDVPWQDIIEGKLDVQE